MDAELLELLDEAPDEYSALEYGRHSLYSSKERMVDVRDVLADHYVGRHSPVWLISNGRYPLYPDELGAAWY